MKNCLALLLMISAAGAPAASIDFEDLGVAAGSQLNPNVDVSQNSGGFTFASPGADLHFLGPGGGLSDNGTTRLLVHGFVDFSPVVGGVFSLSSFSFDYWITERNSVTVIGQLSGGGSVSQTFTTDGTPDGSFETFVLNGGFTNLTSVRVDSGVPNFTTNTGFALDNIVVNVDAGGQVGAVPEPGTLGLLAGGLLLAAFGRRRKSA